MDCMYKGVGGWEGGGVGGGAGWLEGAGGKPNWTVWSSYESKKC